ncbi:MAG TPA: acetylglutamate kinase [Dehalococcoidia bacterium]
MSAAETVVVKIGGSTFGSGDTTLADAAALRRTGARVVIVHGGGAEITRWLGIHQVPSHFVDGLRVTDAAAIDVVVAVLAGVVNKRLVAQLGLLGVPALGLCGPDGGVLTGEIENPALGFVGAVREVATSVLETLLGAGLLPVIAPIAVQRGTAQLLNVNGDTAAGEVAAALPGARLVFLTDVAGVLDADGKRIERLDADGCATLREAGVLQGGMLPKIDACLVAAAAGSRPIIVDGRAPHALLNATSAEPAGTVFI